MSMSSVSHARHALAAELVQDLWVAVRSAQLYEPTNETLKLAGEKLAACVRSLHEIDQAASLEVGDDIIEVNGTRVRMELHTYELYSKLRQFVNELGVGGFEWTALMDGDEAAHFAAVVGRYQSNGGPAHATLSKRLAEAGIQNVKVLTRGAEIVHDPFAAADALTKERVGVTYRMGVAVVRDLLESQREGRLPPRYRIRRAVQSIVDEVLTEEMLILGMTCLRDYDEPTFTHSVNVCILSVSLGHKIGLTRLELYKLGLAALLHDIGKVDVPKEVLNKAGSLTDDEWSIMQRHTTYGAWRLITERAEGTMPAHEMLVAFEHHLNVDLSGYPKLYAPRGLSFHSKIVGIADAFDAGTTPRVYKTDPITPARMVEILEEQSRTRFDPVLVKAFISVLGIVPVGSMCLLDTGEVAIVMSPDQSPKNLRRPRVRLIAAADGVRVDGPEVSLTEKDDNGRYSRSIVKVLDPDKYGIDIPSHFSDA
jgi:HD-GYP domain-containing protein (c-di-GMP phosphodiesterase class II)